MEVYEVTFAFVALILFGEEIEHMHILASYKIGEKVEEKIEN
jgi:hypothetical protein